jgi:hypothetical protein
MSVEARVERASEQILGDESLTDELMDAEANTLINWALERVYEIAQHTDGLDDDAAKAILDEHLLSLRDLMRRVNKLVSQLSAASPGMAMSMLAEIHELAARLPEGQPAALPGDLVEAQALRELPPGDALRRILTDLVGPKNSPTA